MLMLYQLKMRHLNKIRETNGGKIKDCPNRTEEFRDSTAFLKGTQSLNPHNDYSQNFVDTGQRPQNFIRKQSYLL